MMPVCRPAAGSPCPAYVSQWGSAVSCLENVREDLGWTVLFFFFFFLLLPAQTEHSLTMSWCNPKTTQFRLVRIPLPHPQRDVLAASRWRCTTERSGDCTTAPGNMGRMGVFPEKSGYVVCSKTKSGLLQGQNIVWFPDLQLGSMLVKMFPVNRPIHVVFKDDSCRMRPKC